MSRQRWSRRAGVALMVIGAAGSAALAQSRNSWALNSPGSDRVAVITVEAKGSAPSDLRGMVMALRCQRPSRALSAQFVTGISGSGSARATVQNDRGAWIRLRSARHTSGMVHVTKEEEVRQIAKIIREAGSEILVTIDGRVATVPVRGASLPVQRAIEHCERVPGRTYPSAPLPRDLSLPGDLRGPAPAQPAETPDPAPSPGRGGAVTDPTQL